MTKQFEGWAEVTLTDGTQEFGFVTGVAIGEIDFVEVAFPGIDGLAHAYILLIQDYCVKSIMLTTQNGVLLAHRRRLESMTVRWTDNPKPGFWKRWFARKD